MRHLFCPAGDLAMAQLMQRRALLAFDFDGTLAPIVDRPELAQTHPALARTLSALAHRHPVAVVTGRSVADVRPRLGFEPHYIVGNHGAEGLGWVPDAPILQHLREWVQAHGEKLRASGVILEDKGLSLAMHYRLAPDAAKAKRAIAKFLDAAPANLATFGGKRVVNVTLRAAPDKGDAVLRLLESSGCQTVLFVGDDVNDEAVFERAAAHWLTIRVGPPYAASKAMFVLQSQGEVAQLVSKLVSLSVP